MRRNTFINILLLGLVSLLMSCRNDGEQIYLSPETDILHFGEVGGVSRIKISTNSSDIRAIPDVQWILTECEGDYMKVKVDANPTASARSSEVKVLAGKVTRTIRVEQTAAPETVSPVTKSVTTSFLAISSEFYVRKNVAIGDWEVSCDADWVSFTIDRNNDKVLFNVARNETTVTRTAIISFSSNNKLLDEVFTIVQEGKPVYYLPFERWGMTSNTIRVFEEARGNVVKRIPDGVVFKAWGYKTCSDKFDYMEYEFNGSKSFTSRLYPQKDFALLAFNPTNMPALRAFFEGNGFVEESNEYFINEKLHMSAGIVRRPVYGLPYIEYKVYSKQTENYPTLSIDDFLGIFADYKAENFFTPAEYEYEKTHSGVIDQESTNSTTTFFRTPPPFLYRLYSIQKTGRVLSTNMCLTNMNLVFYEDEGGNKFFTKEFLKMMTDAGFEHTYTNPYSGMHIFQNKARKLSFSVWYNSTKFTGGIKRVLTQVETL